MRGGLHMIARLARWLLVSALVFGTLFGLGGRTDLPRLWATACVFAAMLLLGLFMIDPEVTRERWKRHPTADPVVLALVRTLAISVFVVAPLDVGRFHWSDSVPLGLSVPALVAFAAAFLFALTAIRANRFWASQLRIQTERGHRVVDRGPYRFVRHPGYAAMTVFAPAAGLAMGSWIALLVGVACALTFVYRTTLEDRFLRENLEGYADYARRVRFRLVPGVW